MTTNTYLILVPGKLRLTLECVKDSVDDSHIRDVFELALKDTDKKISIQIGELKYEV